MRYLIISIVLLCTSCSLRPDNRDGAEVVVDRWQVCGSNGATGYVINVGEKKARDVRIKTAGPCGGGYYESRCSPRDLEPGEVGMVGGAASGRGCAGCPEVVWIRWD